MGLREAEERTEDVRGRGRREGGGVLGGKGERRRTDEEDEERRMRKDADLFGGDGLVSLLAELLEGGRVVAQVDLGANEHDPRLVAVLVDLGQPLLGNAVKGGRLVGREAEDENIGSKVALREAENSREGLGELVGKGIGCYLIEKKAY